MSTRKLQSEVYTGPITISQFQRLNYVREALEKDGFSIPLPTGLGASNRWFANRKH